MNRWPKRIAFALAAGFLAVLAWLVVRSAAGAKGRPADSVNQASEPGISGRQVVCVGRIEPAGGEVDLCAQMAGTLEIVTVKEGDQVEAGALLAVVHAPREKAELDLARARLARTQAGFGAEELAAAAAQCESVAAELALAERDWERARTLKDQQVVSDDFLDIRRQRVETLKKRVASLQKQVEAMRRGPIPEEVAVARAEVEAAKANYELRQVRAPFAGTVLQLYRHTGDAVQLNFPTPILRLADTSRLQARLELNEADVYRIQPGLEGAFTVLGRQGLIGRLRVRTILPSFGPKRLFDPDTSAQVDTRTLQVLCDIMETRQPVYLGQRITAVLPAGQPASQ